MSLIKKLQDYLVLIRLFLGNRAIYSTIVNVKKHRISYLRISALHELQESITRLEKKKVPGIFIEAGCALGGSAIVIASVKKPNRIFKIFDTFEGIPSPSAIDEDDASRRFQKISSGVARGIKGDKYYGYEEDLLATVVANFGKFGIVPEAANIEFIKGNFDTTMHFTGPVAFAHIDADWYLSVMMCLERIEPNLVTGGLIVVDDYFTWIGCRKAIDEYFSDKIDNYSFYPQNALHITKNSVSDSSNPI